LLAPVGVIRSEDADAPEDHQNLRRRGAARPRDRFLWDTECAGFGLKVTPTGARVYLLQYRTGARLPRFTIGRHGWPWTAERARREALRLLGAVARQNSPTATSSRQGDARQSRLRARYHWHWRASLLRWPFRAVPRPDLFGDAVNEPGACLARFRPPTSQNGPP